MRFNGIRNGIVPSILLPESLTPSSSVTGMTEESANQGTSSSTKKKSSPKGKAELNPEVRPEWRIPPGKRFGNFFSPSRSDLKANIAGWSSLPHHSLKIERPMCLRYQVTAEGVAGCPNAHILPSAMPHRTWDSIHDRLSKIVLGGTC